jgi:arginase
VTVILVPYHLDEHQPGLDYPLEPGVTVAAGPPAGGIWDRLGALYGDVADRVAADAGAGVAPVVMSGDCTTSLGTMAGLQRAGADAGIVWLDAHGDVQTLETTSSGYLGGIPLRILAGYRPELISARLGLRAVPEPRIALVGARDLDPPEAAYLAASQIRQLPVAGLDAAGLPDGPLYLHVDLDVIDSAALPGLLYPAPGGPAPAAVTAALRTVLATGRVAALGVACTWRAGQGAGPAAAAVLDAALAGWRRDGTGAGAPGGRPGAPRAG